MSLATKSCLPLSRQTLSKLSPNKSDYSEPHYAAYIGLRMGYAALRSLLYERPRFTITLDLSFETDQSFTITRNPDYPSTIGQTAFRSGGFSRSVVVYCKLEPGPNCFDVFNGQIIAPLSVGLACSLQKDYFGHPDSFTPFFFDTLWSATTCKTLTTLSRIDLFAGGEFLIGKRHGKPWGALLFYAGPSFLLSDPLRQYVDPSIPPSTYQGYFFNVFGGAAMSGGQADYIYTGDPKAWLQLQNLYIPGREGSGGTAGSRYVTITPVLGEGSLTTIPLSTQQLNYENKALAFNNPEGFSYDASGSTKIAVTGISIQQD